MKPSKELKEIWRKDPDNWKFALLYLNKEESQFSENVYN